MQGRKLNLKGADKMRFDREREKMHKMYELYIQWVYLKILWEVIKHAMLWLPIWLWYTILSLHPVVAFENTKWYLAMRLASVMTQYMHTIVICKLYAVNRRLYETHRKTLNNYSETNQRDMKEFKEFVLLFTESGDMIADSHSLKTYLSHLDKYDEYINRLKKEIKECKSR